MTRWPVAGAALAVGGLTVAVAALAASSAVRPIVVEAGVAGWVLLAAALAWRAALLTPAMVGLGLAAALLVARRTDTAAAIVPAAALLVATGELAGWSFDLRSVVPESAVLTARRLASTAALTFGSAAGAGAVLALSGLPAPSGLLPLVVGASAAVANVALAALRRW
jgi:hypothetical protein